MIPARPQVHIHWMLQCSSILALYLSNYIPCSSKRGYWLFKTTCLEILATSPWFYILDKLKVYLIYTFKPASVSLPLEATKISCTLELSATLCTATMSTDKVHRMRKGLCINNFLIFSFSLLWRKEEENLHVEKWTSYVTVNTFSWGM